MNRLLFVCFFFLSFTLYGTPHYTLCIDGGGSKTILQAIDETGRFVSLFKEGVKSDCVVAGGSNINVIGVDGVRAVFQALFDETQIGEERTHLKSILSECACIAGMAGVGLAKNKEAVLSLIQEWGVLDPLVFSDAELALQLVEDKGIVLIAGTGSICFGKHDGQVFRVGGLGRILGDEGSGYQIGLQGIKGVLAEEYGWGTATALTPALREFFNVTEMRSLIPSINSGEMPHSKIASCAPLIFRRAWEGDSMARVIIHRAADDLSHLLIQMLRISQLSDCKVHLWGGVFKSKYIETFIEEIMQHSDASRLHLTFVNHAHANPAILYALKYLAKI